MLDCDLDMAKGRLHIRYSGFWTSDDGRDALRQFGMSLERARSALTRFTLLDDMRTWQPQALGIVETNRAFALLCIDMPIVRNAMVIPSPLIRRQVLRTLDADENCRIFEHYDEADAWLAAVEPTGRR